MTEPDKSNVRLISDAVTHGLRRTYTPDPTPIPDVDDDNSWRDILADFERRFQQAKAEESER